MVHEIMVIFARSKETSSLDFNGPPDIIFHGRDGGEKEEDGQREEKGRKRVNSSRSWR